MLCHTLSGYDLPLFLFHLTSLCHDSLAEYVFLSVWENMVLSVLVLKTKALSNISTLNKLLLLYATRYLKTITWANNLVGVVITSRSRNRQLTTSHLVLEEDPMMQLLLGHGPRSAMKEAVWLVPYVSPQFQRWRPKFQRWKKIISPL